MEHIDRMMLACKVAAGEEVVMETPYRALMVSAYAEGFLGVRGVRRKGCSVYRDQVEHAA